jgi:hypothetical protein
VLPEDRVNVLRGDAVPNGHVIQRGLPNVHISTFR